MSPRDTYDLAVIGGGINGAGIACDAAGRGLSVLLCEAGDLGGGTSSASSKLIHGGLRYLEHYEFFLVRKSLRESETLLRKAPHIVWPLRFVLPHAPDMRPSWMLRAGLALYDTLYHRRAIPGSEWISLVNDPAGAPLKKHYAEAVSYWDCWVDDARLVVLNARAAADRGAEILTRTAFREARVEDGRWRVRLRDAAGAEREIETRVLINAAGPWADRVQAQIGLGASARSAAARLRLVKGSHIVLPRLEGADCAYLLQNQDGRVVFALPFEGLTLVGTTEAVFEGDPAEARIGAEETDYLLDVVARFFDARVGAQDIVWTYAGVRPLIDGGESDASSVSRDYAFEIKTRSGAPVLTVLGGKLTTYRQLAEDALEALAPYVPNAKGPWTERTPLPGGDMREHDFERFVAGLTAQRPELDAAYLRQLARRHGTLVDDVLGDATAMRDLGPHFGAGLYQREVAYFARREWARTGEDVLWRRTKAGLHLKPEDRTQAAEAIESVLAREGQ